MPRTRGPTFACLTRNMLETGRHKYPAVAAWRRLDDCPPRQPRTDLEGHPSLPDFAIVDLDGALSFPGDRGPDDAGRWEGDEVNAAVHFVDEAVRCRRPWAVVPPLGREEHCLGRVATVGDATGWSWEYLGRSGNVGGYRVEVGENRVRVLKDGVAVIDYAVPPLGGESIGTSSRSRKTCSSPGGGCPTGRRSSSSPTRPTGRTKRRGPERLGPRTQPTAKHHHAGMCLTDQGVPDEVAASDPIAGRGQEVATARSWPVSALARCPETAPNRTFAGERLPHSRPPRCGRPGAPSSPSSSANVSSTGSTSEIA